MFIRRMKCGMSVGTLILGCLCLSLSLSLKAETISTSEAEAHVEALYLETLQRLPDPNGLASHAQLLVDGMPIDDMRSALANSDEGQQVAKRREKQRRLLCVPVLITGLFIVVVYLRRKSTKDFVFKMILVGLSLLLTCLVAEAGLRAVAQMRSRQTAEAWRNVEGVKRPNPNALVTLKDVIHLCPYHDIIYELFPNLDVRFLGKAAHTDEHGFRITPGSEESDHAFRIAGLGDSVMFGWGVADEDTYLTTLCALLKSDVPNRAVTVWNSAVPGYNTTMEVETLEQKLISREPDLVLLHYIDNDLILPNFIPQTDETVQATRSHLMAAVSRWRGGRLRIHTFDRLVRRKGPPPAEYAHMVGEEACVAQLRRLARLAGEHDFKVALICNWDTPDFIASATRELGIPVIALGETIRSYRKIHNIKKYIGSELTVDKHDPHYSALAHQLVAKEIYRRLKEEQFITP